MTSNEAHGDGTLLGIGLAHFMTCVYAHVGHDSSESLRGDDKSGSHLMGVGSGQSVAALERPPHDPSRPSPGQDARAKQNSRGQEQAVSLLDLLIHLDPAL